MPVVQPRTAGRGAADRSADSIAMLQRRNTSPLEGLAALWRLQAAPSCDIGRSRPPAGSCHVQCEAGMRWLAVLGLPAGHAY